MVTLLIMLTFSTGCGSNGQGRRALENGSLGDGPRGDRGPEVSTRSWHGYLGCRVSHVGKMATSVVRLVDGDHPISGVFSKLNMEGK